MMSMQLSYVKTNLFKLSDINWETTDYPPAHYHVLYSVHLLWLHTHSLIRLEDLRQCEGSVFIFRQLTSNDYYFAISSIAEKTFHSSLYARDPRQSCALDSTPWIPSSRYSVLDPRLQSLVGFRIPKPRISDSTSTNFHDSGLPKKKIYRIHVHGAIWCSWKF